MNRKINLIFIFSLIFLTAIFQSCGKEWLEAKPDKALVVPEDTKDFQALLDNYNKINVLQAGGLGEMSAGDFYILYASWQSLYSVEERSAYIWAQTTKFYGGEPSGDWVNSYAQILIANIVLEGIVKIKHSSSEQQDWNNVNGSALFLRAFDFFNLAQEYCNAYVPTRASSELGLPLRLESNVNADVKRSNLEDTYSQIINDLKSAAALLSTAPLYKTRPSKQAAFALLARTYISMESYDQAVLYADSALQIQNSLMDFSKLNENAAYPVARFNPEVIFHSTFSYGIFGASRLIVEPSLYDSYGTDDYRRSVFFTSKAGGGMTYKGSYNADKNLFGGLATDELYLIRAECNARKGKVSAALNDLNRLLRNRQQDYQDIKTNDANAALIKILTERRKELVFRGLRWSDLRRLNRDNRFAVTLTRELNGKTYSLPPNDKRYVFPLDEIEIKLGGLIQNERE